MDEKNATPDQELDDEQLERVAGGLTKVEWNGKTYRYVGAVSFFNMFHRDDFDKCYLCPNCGRPVHFGAGCRYYCDPCDESWYYESKLIPNLTSGVWEEVS